MEEVYKPWSHCKHSLLCFLTIDSPVTQIQNTIWSVGSSFSTKGQNLLKLKSCCSHPTQPLILLSQGCLALIQLTDKSKVLPPVTNQSQATPSNKRWRQILAPKDKIWRCEANWSFNLIQARRPCINFSHRQKPLSPGITHKQLSQTEPADESMWEGFWCWRRMLIGSKPDWDQILRPGFRTRFWDQI